MYRRKAQVANYLQPDIQSGYKLALGVVIRQDAIGWISERGDTNPLPPSRKCNSGQMVKPILESVDLKKTTRFLRPDMAQG
jgi:hypothetical protein